MPRAMKYFFATARFLLLMGWLAASLATAQSTGSPAAVAAPAAASTSSAATTDIIPELHVGQDVYYDVRVTEVTPVTIVFIHRHGISSVALVDLSPDLQKRFGYDPVKAAAETARRQAENVNHKVAANTAAGNKGPPSPSAQQILQRFGHPPKIFAQANMRPRFELLGVGVKNQGPRPSSAVFAIVSAMEYQCAPPEGPAPEFSEEYLIWATLKSLGKNVLAVPKNQAPTLDIGFSLIQVADALRGYGIALAGELPYHFDITDPHILEPAADVIERAKQRSPSDGNYITDREPSAQVSNIIQVLDFGVPVIVTIDWPEQKVFSDNGRLDEQPGLANSGRTVLLVGYGAKSPKLEDVEFLFKNSYGDNWGDHGYGIVTYKYLVSNLHDALFLIAH